jgi:DNA helicase-2/ATP-dependent DNA helicase PcrA
VVIEAPAGCGKTHQGADYANELTTTGHPGLPLIITHTHAACSVFAERTKTASGRVDIRTIDSVIGQIAAAYHVGLGLPADIAAWVRQNRDGHKKLAIRVAKLLASRPMIAAALARRHSVVICDEHQDSSGDQHAVVMALLEQGAKVRIFADPMQKIFKEKTLKGSCPPCDWNALGSSAQAFECLDYPHRWVKGCTELGRWTLNARERLKAKERIDLRSGRPSSLRLIYAENVAQTRFGYQLKSQDRSQVDLFIRETQAEESLLVLAHYNDTALSLRAFFGRRLPLWEGHTRPGLEGLVNAVSKSQGDGAALANAIVAFMKEVGKGFSPSAFGNAFMDEVRDGCVKARKGKTAFLQELARLLVDEPSHRGVAKVLHRLRELTTEQKTFREIEIDCQREFWEAIQLANFDAPDVGLAEITHRRTYSRPKPPRKAISTIHKAKGLESDRVLLLPCDSTTFPDTFDSRCLLYVALSRAKQHLMLVVSRDKPSPLFII